MNANRQNLTHDALTVLKDAGAVTSSGVGQVGGSNKIIDLAGDPAGTSIPPTAGMAAAPDTPAEAVIDISACDAASTDETYALYVEGSTSPTFASGNQILAQIPITRGTTGRFKLPFSNWQNGTTHRYLRCGHTLGGTTPSINYTCRLAKQTA